MNGLNLMASTRRVFLATGLCLAAFVATVSANHIDFISDGGFFVNTGSTGTLSDSQTGSPDNIRGTERQITLSTLEGAGFVSAGTMDAVTGAAPSALPSTGTLLLSNSARVKGRFQLTYDGVGSAGLGGQNFSGTWNSIVVDFEDVQGAGNLSLKVTDSSNLAGTATLPVTAAGNVSFPFSAAGFAGVNFASVNSVQLTLDSTEFASDFSLRSITLAGVPEPTSMAGLLAILAFGGQFRRRR